MKMRAIVMAALLACAGFMSASEAQIRETPKTPPAKTATQPPPPAVRPQPVPQPQPQSDPCVQARLDWPAAEQSTSLSIVRAYRDSVPVACGMYRVRADERVGLLEREEAQQRSTELAKSRETARQNAIVARYEQHSQALVPAFEALSPYGKFWADCNDGYGRWDANIYQSASGFRLSGGEGLKTHARGDLFILAVSGSLVETISRIEVRENISWNNKFLVPAEVPREDRMVWDFQQRNLRYRLSATATDNFWYTKRRC